MPGGVAGAQSIMAAPYADACENVSIAGRKFTRAIKGFPNVDVIYASDIP
jgi:hypothetical protein